VDEMISDYKDIEYLEIKQSESDEIIHISRQKGFLEVACRNYYTLLKQGIMNITMYLVKITFYCIPYLIPCFEGYFCWKIDDKKRKSSHADRRILPSLC
jgi:hypothetical protein